MWGLLKRLFSQDFSVSRLFLFESIGICLKKMALKSLSLIPKKSQKFWSRRGLMIFGNKVLFLAVRKGHTILSLIFTQNANFCEQNTSFSTCAHTHFLRVSVSKFWSFKSLGVGLKHYQRHYGPRRWLLKAICIFCFSVFLHIHWPLVSKSQVSDDG